MTTNWFSMCSPESLTKATRWSFHEIGLKKFKDDKRLSGPKIRRGNLGFKVLFSILFDKKFCDL